MKCLIYQKHNSATKNSSRCVSTSHRVVATDATRGTHHLQSGQRPIIVLRAVGPRSPRIWIIIITSLTDYAQIRLSLPQIEWRHTCVCSSTCMRRHVRMCRCYFKQLLEGMHYCHKNNILHRDIKAYFYMYYHYRRRRCRRRHCHRHCRRRRRRYSARDIKGCFRQFSE